MWIQLRHYCGTKLYNLLQVLLYVEFVQRAFRLYTPVLSPLRANQLLPRPTHVSKSKFFRKASSASIRHVENVNCNFLPVQWPQMRSSSLISSQGTWATSSRLNCTFWTNHSKTTSAASTQGRSSVTWAFQSETSKATGFVSSSSYASCICSNFMQHFIWSC
jgi:hypothetical protein